MSVQSYFQIVGAVFLGNMLSLVMVYGVWRATKAEKEQGLANGAHALPLWLLLAMMIGPLVSAWAAATLS